MEKKLDEFLSNRKDSDLLQAGLNDLKESMKQKISNLQDDLKSSKDSLHRIEMLFELIREKQFATIIKKGDFFHKILNEKSTMESSHRDLGNKIFKYSIEKCQELARSYPKLIQDFSISEKIPIDQTSRHPKYTFCEGFITLEIYDKTFEARAFSRGNHLFTIPFDIETVVSALKKEINRLFNRSLDENKFTKSLFSHYNSIIKKENYTFGDPIPIYDIFNRLNKKKKKKIKIDEFIVDLSKLIQKGAPLISGRRLDLTQTRDEKSGILLHHFESRGYIGFLKFKFEE
jgi:hypothetical protein